MFPSGLFEAWEMPYNQWQIKTTLGGANIYLMHIMRLSSDFILCNFMCNVRVHVQYVNSHALYI